MRLSIALVLLAACASAPAVIHPSMPDVVGAEQVVSGTGLRYVDVQQGDGPVATRGWCVYPHYTLYRRNGQWLQSSTDSVAGKPGEPIAFVLGTGRVIRGWDLGIEGMQVGGVRRLFVPEEMGYGANGSPPLIPPHAFLVFDIRLMDVRGSQGGVCAPWRLASGE